MHLTTNDLAAHLKFVIEESDNITMSHIDEQGELKRYQEEDLRSPCTQEIAVLRAFAEIKGYMLLSI